ncbi:ABC transporter substrate-binding protein [Modestobacter caceresii]|uniref:ABC transporter substrate-binding protein n=1 Tax=Modestobacter caceresii TaxID=1522368 RepID=A0A098Y5P5_9ACTN|nr:ABC transporter substrate-binding protein [Modestobacter caceresii]
MKSTGRTWAPRMACAVTVSLALAACGGGSGGDGGSSDDGFTMMSLNENTTQDSVITSLSEDQCATQDEALPLDITEQAQESVDQQIQLLAGQGALPDLFPANTPDLIRELAENDQVANVQDVLADGDAADAIVPAAESAADQIFGDQLVLPVELNIEGIWFNKEILEANGIAVPQTWDELVAAFETLQAAGVQPITNAGSGGDGWGISRWIGAYLFRTIGPDAMRAIADGEASLTDPEYVEAAQAIAELGEAGYFGPAPNSIDYATAINTFLTGEAAFMYMGSWALADFNDPEANQIGEDAIGFLPFPEVEGGEGNSDQTPTNLGTSIVLSSAVAEEEQAQAWVECIASNYGSVALRDHGQITGLQLAEDVEVPPLTGLVQDQIEATDESVLWFEALFPASATTASQQNAGLVGSGQMSGEDFMSAVSAELG